MLRTSIAIVMITAGAAAAKPAPTPEPVHRAEIRPGSEWWCYVEGATGQPSCMRSEEQCHEVQRAMGTVVEAAGRQARAAGVEAPSAGDPSVCTLTAAVWVRTGSFGSSWNHVIAPTKAMCEAVPAMDRGIVEHDSGCRLWHESESPPDTAAVPAGKGWSCYAAGATTICARTKDWCAVAYRISHGDGSAPACKPAKRAFVFTSGGAFHAFGDAAACAAARDDDAAASTCAAE